ncbi:hypothetical protein BFP70_05095 [Thioclava sp. SK-1]|uniref:GumC family protein n=1 Tax=Thioclava sp. SK-1 TaxID=1889770 RepID=UPI0008264617|nr:hypothetical protein [Thioclava sp. SK-1]OCX66402.1 hypothetical protein BFP70_05095 [Thioclava sp. SK-1]
MNSDIRFYLALFWRRLPLFMLVFILCSVTGILAALTLPPVYRSQMQLVVESSQIPDRLATSTVTTPAEEQLQLFETRLLTRDNLLDVARKLNAVPEQAEMSPDQIVRAMRANTLIKSSSGRNSATTMSLSFDSPSPQIAANVLNEYLTFILAEDAQYRTGRANQTQEFFENEVARLGTAMSAQSGRILEFKTANSDALPESQNYFQSLQLNYQNRTTQIDRDIAGLEKQKMSLRQIYEATGQVSSIRSQMSPQEQRIQDLRNELADMEAVYAADSPRVTVLRKRLSQMEANLGGGANDDTPSDPGEAVFNLQISDIESQIEQLQDERDYYNSQLKDVQDALAKIPGNTITLGALERDYKNIQDQYNVAVDRLSQASTGERIESLSRGQRVSVVEQPSVPSEPIKPSRKKIAAAGILGGIMAGLGLIAVLEMLSTTIKRSSDLSRALDITPLATIPYLTTKTESRRRRTRQIALTAGIGIAIPVAVWVIHSYYMPFEVIAQKIAQKIGLYI